MSFKNALKNLVAHFGTVWSLLLYILLFAALITGLSLPFIMPIARAFIKAGVVDGIRSAFGALFGEGGWNGMWSELNDVFAAVFGVFEDNSVMTTLIMTFFIFIVVVAFRFFLGLYEIPLATVIDGRLSCNANYGFMGKLFSTLVTSVGYSLAKMVVTVSFDAVMALIITGIAQAVGFNMWLLFISVFVFLVLGAFRFSIIACWAPCVASGEYGVIKGFFHSAKICFKRFGSIYSTYIVSLLLFIAVGMFITIFTLGVGLIVILPFGTTYFGYLNATVYYNKSGKRYYVDGAVFVPPVENVL